MNRKATDNLGRTGSPFAYGLCNCGLRANVYTHRVRHMLHGDLAGLEGRPRAIRPPLLRQANSYCDPA